MVIAGILTDASGQQHQLDSSKVIASSEFLRLLVQPADVEGRANLFPDWQRAAVFLSNGRFASDITLNYDVLNNVLLVLVEEKEYSLNPIAVDSILLANNPQVLVNPIIFNSAGSDLLLLRVYQGQHLSLFRNTLATVLVGDNDTTSSTELRYTRSEVQIDHEQRYFLFNKVTNVFREFQGKKKELKQWENGNQVLTFIKNQNLELTNEADLIQVVKYYEQLTYGN